MHANNFINIKGMMLQQSLTSRDVILKAPYPLSLFFSYWAYQLRENILVCNYINFDDI